MNSREINQQKFAIAVLKVAKEKGFSLRKLADASGLEYSQVQRISKGKVNIALSTIFSISEGLEITPTELFRMME